MNIHSVKRVNDNDWSAIKMDQSHYDKIIDDKSDFTILKEDGSILACVLRGDVPRHIETTALHILMKIRMRTDARATATGTKTIRKVKKDGTLSKNTRASHKDGGIVMSSIVGYFERTARYPYCRACSWNLQYPEEFKKIVPLAQHVSNRFMEYNSARYLAQKEFADKTHPDFLIPGTVFTTMTVNHNFRTAAHKDAGDLHQGFGTMVYFERGLLKGGELIFPNYRAGVKLRHGDVVLFDVHEFHGNTEVKYLSRSADRCTVVMYYREKIQGCGSAKEELDRAKNRKLGEKLFDGEKD